MAWLVYLKRKKNYNLGEAHVYADTSCSGR